MSINKVQVGKNLYDIASIYDTIAKNAGAHNSIYRGENITDKWYDGTLSAQIAAGTFDDIFIGDYIIGKTSGRKYFVADINYYINQGDTECTTNHILLVPEKIFGKAQMNTSYSASTGFVNSSMYITGLDNCKTIIINDFESSHLLTHSVYLSTAASTYETAGEWKDVTINLMNECMTVGSNVFHNCKCGTNVPVNSAVDESQLALFRLNRSALTTWNDTDTREAYWLRDVASNTDFCTIGHKGNSGLNSADNSDTGIRPYFLLY